MHFWKYEGLGNDFVIVHDDVSLTKQQIVAICDRHRGIGADGVLIVTTDPNHAAMRVINADGSVPEMCGNGIRCAALHVARLAKLTRGTLSFDTDAGPHPCRVIEVDALHASGLIEVAMRPALLSPSQVPVIAKEPVIDERFDFDGRSLHLTAVSMGNPHAVTFDDVGEARVALGPKIQKHSSFPKSVNVGFATLSAADTIELAVLERGAGWTEACGTGACAAAVAAVETQRIARGRPVTVRLPGGSLTIEVNGRNDSIRMTGPARLVFEGDLAL